jgi:hypothetical protein
MIGAVNKFALKGNPVAFGTRPNNLGHKNQRAWGQIKQEIAPEVYSQGSK